MREFQLLVIDDDDLVLQTIRMALPPSWSMIGISNPKEVPNKTFHAALIDMHLTGNINKAEGVDLIKTLRDSNSHLEIVAMSGNLDRELMEKCLRAGASRFLAKPLSKDELQLTLDKIEALFLLQGASNRREMKPWIGSGTASQDVRRQIAALKNESGPILIEGETGTGKEVAAQLIHAQEGLNTFIAVNVASLPENLFESEMFGHVKGAFTGADQNKMGLAEAAHGGDLFLDEIEALLPQHQAKFLRFLETGEVRRIGAKDNIHVKARLIAASNKNLTQMVKEEKFREDLLWRLSGKILKLPPLRERREDIVELFNHFMSLDPLKRKKQLAPEAVEALQNYNWPGNVRELKRVCEQLLLHAPLPVIRKEDITRLLNAPAGNIVEGLVDLSLGLSSLMDQFEARMIRQCLDKHPDIDEAARVLQISRSSLYKKISDHEIEWKG